MLHPGDRREAMAVMKTEEMMVKMTPDETLTHETGVACVHGRALAICSRDDR